MRTFNGLQIFTEQLTNSGQLDLRYVRISGNTQPANIFLGNLNQNYSFHVNENFNITNSTNIFLSNNATDYTGYMPDLLDKSIFTIKNISLDDGQNHYLRVTGYASTHIFDQSQENFLDLGPNQGISCLGIKNNYYTGWTIINSSEGAS